MKYKMRKLLTPESASTTAAGFRTTVDSIYLHLCLPNIDSLHFNLLPFNLSCLVMSWLGLIHNEPKTLYLQMVASSVRLHSYLYKGSSKQITKLPYNSYLLPLCARATLSSPYVHFLSGRMAIHLSDFNF
jgi:hypothetical protein